MNERTILHCDLNNFFASVECVLDPSLKGKYVAVCGNQKHRHGIVLAKNTLAKAAGVTTGETIVEARKKCPALVVVSPHYEEYVNYAKKVQKIYKEYTDKVESFGLDECWLDVTNSANIFGDGKKIADEIRQRVKKDTGMTISVGVSFNKIFAKLGSDLKKPDATTEITRQNFKEIVWKLPVDAMLMIGKRTRTKLAKFNIFTLGELAISDEQLMKYVFGINGVKIKQWAMGNDQSIVMQTETELPIKSVGHSTTTIVDVSDYYTAKQVLWYLSDMVALRLREYGFKANGVQVSIRYNNLEFVTKQKTLPNSTFDGGELAKTGYSLLKEIWGGPNDLALRLIGISAFNLSVVAQNTQEDFFDNKNEEKQETLNFTVDKIRKKYGFNSMLKGTLLNNSVMTDKAPIEDTEFLPFKKLT